MSSKAGRKDRGPAPGRPGGAQRAWIGGLTGVLALGLVLAWAVLRTPSEGEQTESTHPPASAATARAEFVGSSACTGCHAAESALWQGSQHQRAMLPATSENVHGAFEGSTLADAGASARFSRIDERFVVRAVGADGANSDHAIEYVFGVDPLEQYLVPMPGGRWQALPFAWDTRAKDARGQRWFHLYPGEPIGPGDPLHWTRPAQNWNHVCADCHTTAFRKRFDADRDAFDSQWKEIGVGCESCHGPGSAHAEWARSSGEVGEAGSGQAADAAANGARSAREMGLVARLDERRNIRWTVDPTTGNAVRSVPRTSARELDVCAPCHARRNNITESYAAGEPFLDHYRPALLDPGLYFADGQQRDEVYSWGSFLQSRMHAKGVTCSDCHEPHSGALRAEGNALCASCHAAAKYATPEHHRHAEASAGSECVACHMPTTTYMVVDPRHDHSLRVPRPDQTVALGVPNACQGCHAERPIGWADEALRGWLGRPARGFERHAAAFHASELDAPDAGPALRAVAADASQPAIVRASALARLDGSQSRTSAEALARAVRDSDPLVRLGALEGLASAPDPVRIRAAGETLRDPRRVVRFEAVRLLASASRELPPAVRSVYDREAVEYEAALRRDADRAEARTQLGVFLAERGDAEGAHRELEAAIAIEPDFEPAHVNLADLERAFGREAEAMQVLDAALARLPESAALHHARGLARVRAGQTLDAEADLARAVALNPQSARFAYVYAVAMHSGGKVREAIELLESAAAAHPDDRSLREALISFHAGAGDTASAARHQEALGGLQAADP